MKQYFECRFSGSGGQGMMLAGQVLAEAAGIYECKNVVQTRSYGPEARGGASRSELIIADEPIEYLEVSQPDFILAMTQEAFDKYLDDLKQNGLVVIDPEFVNTSGLARKDIKLCSVPITEIAREQVGNKLTANIVALGVMGALTGVVSKNSLEAAVLDAVPRGTEAINAKALAAGYQIVATLQSNTRKCG